MTRVFGILRLRAPPRLRAGYFLQCARTKQRPPASPGLKSGFAPAAHRGFCNAPSWEGGSGHVVGAQGQTKKSGNLRNPFFTPNTTRKQQYSYLGLILVRTTDINPPIHRCAPRTYPPIRAGARHIDTHPPYFYLGDGD